MRWLTPRRQMTYTQWLELCRKQAAEREAEPEAVTLEASAEDPDPEEEEPKSIACRTPPDHPSRQAPTPTLTPTRPPSPQTTKLRLKFPP